MRIIHAKKEHLEQIAAIYDYYVTTSIATFRMENDENIDFGAILRHNDANSWPFLVMVDQNGDVIGYTHLQAFSELSGYNFTCYDVIYIHPAYLRQGIGTQLLEKLILETKSNTKICNILSYIAIDAGDKTNGSMELHKRHHFQEVGRMLKTGYKFNKWIDVVMMQLRKEKKN